MLYLICLKVAQFIKIKNYVEVTKGTEITEVTEVVYISPLRHNFNFRGRKMKVYYRIRIKF